MDATLGTTNALLAILAAVAVLEVIALIAASVVGYLLFRQFTDLMREVREQIPRLSTRIDGLALQMEDVLSDVKDVTARTAATAQRMHHGFDTAADVASMAVSSAQMVLGRKASLATGIVRGLGVAYRIFTQNQQRKRPRATTVADAPRPVDDDRNDDSTVKEAAHGS